MTIGFYKVNPRAIDWERNDCVVRASTIALQQPYYDVHELYRKAGRKDKRGTFVHMIDAVLGAGMKFTKYDSPTLAQFVKLRGKGRWVVCNRKHAWALIDGVVHDDQKVGSRTRVRCAWRVD